MKVALDVAQTCVERAGCGYYADSLAHALAEHADVSELHLLHHFGSWYNTDTRPGTRIESHKVRAPLAGMTQHEASGFWRELSAGRTSLPGSPDIVHSCSFQAPKIPGVPLVCTIHDVSFWANPEFATEENRLVCQTGTLDAMDRAAGFVFVSQHAHDEFERVTGGWLADSRRPWAVIHEAPRRLPEDGQLRPDIPERFWFTIGSLEPRKNFETLLDAHARYWEASPNPAPLVIAGSEGWKSHALRQRIRDAGPERVRHIGFVSDAELGALYRHALAMIFPSWYEGFGLPVAEAMACGCPVICSDRASLPEVGGDAVCYIKPDSEPAITRAMHEIELNPDLRARIGRAGRERIAEFTWSRAAAATVDLYREVLSTRLEKTTSRNARPEPATL